MNNSENGVSKFFGTWPGAETDQELLAALDEVRKPTELKSGTKVFLIAGMKKKATHIEQVCTTYAIDGRWYWSDGSAVDGSDMRWEAANGPEK